jgi:outer membrane protein assembly factor BamB
MTRKNLLLLPLLAVLALPACSSDDDKAPLEGERISVLELQNALEPDDAALSAQGLVTPEPWRNEFWPQAGGYPNHSMQNLALNTGALKRVWSADIGTGTTDELPLTAQPIVADGKVFTLDTESQLSAFDAQSGKNIWRVNVGKKKEKDDPVISGGVSFGGGVLYVTNGYDEVLALKPADGSVFWRKKIGAPSRSAPTILDQRVFVGTLDNRLLALNAVNGEVLWEYTGLAESAGLIGAASPAAAVTSSCRFSPRVRSLRCALKTARSLGPTISRAPAASAISTASTISRPIPSSTRAS